MCNGSGVSASPGLQSEASSCVYLQTVVALRLCSTDCRLFLLRGRLPTLAGAPQGAAAALRTAGLALALLLFGIASIGQAILACDVRKWLRNGSSQRQPSPVVFPWRRPLTGAHRKALRRHCASRVWRRPWSLCSRSALRPTPIGVMDHPNARCIPAMAQWIISTPAESP